MKSFAYLIWNQIIHDVWFSLPPLGPGTTSNCLWNLSIERKFWIAILLFNEPISLCFLEPFHCSIKLFRVWKGLSSSCKKFIFFAFSILDPSTASISNLVRMLWTTILLFKDSISLYNFEPFHWSCNFFQLGRCSNRNCSMLALLMQRCESFHCKVCWVQCIENNCCYWYIEYVFQSAAEFWSFERVEEGIENKEIKPRKKVSFYSMVHYYSFTITEGLHYLVLWRSEYFWKKGKGKIAQKDWIIVEGATM